jgi:hypothetical protein
MKIQNQYFVKNEHRDMAFASTIGCASCNKYNVIDLKFPFSIESFNAYVKGIVKSHTLNGCNKKQLPFPERASKEIIASIGVDFKATN